VPAVAAGAAIVWLAAWVYLSAFTAAASGYDTAVRTVPWIEHTPPLLFLLFLLPTIAFILLGFVSGSAQGRRLAMLWLMLLLFTEFFYVDDEYTGHYDRFNTTLKWWPWVMAGTLMTLAPFVMEQAKRRWVRIAGFFFCLYPCFYAYDLWKPMWYGPKDSVGKIEGTYYLTKEEFPRLMLGRLKVEKPGVVIERPEEQGGFTNSAVIPLFAGQRMWLGWWGHELLWRENSEDIRRRHDRLMLFYKGGIPAPDAAKWLVARGSTTSSGTGPATLPNYGKRSTRRSDPTMSGATSSRTRTRTDEGWASGSGRPASGSEHSRRRGSGRRGHLELMQPGTIFVAQTDSRGVDDPSKARQGEQEHG
jgi:uncharacterized membrane protein